jgi:hypothetical protein
MKIILAPYSTRLYTGNPNPKNPPTWVWLQVVAKLNSLGHEVIQIGIVGEDRIEGVAQNLTNWPLKALRLILKDADCFLTVDSFLPHFVYAEKIDIRGVVIFSLSDPLIWGHPENINLLKDRKYLREFQYQDWCSPSYNEDAFVSPEEVVNAIANLTRPESPDRTTSLSPCVQLAQIPPS